MRNVLFVCSRNRLRSPTAEQVFADWPGIETSSAGLDHDAENPLTPELLRWADLVFVMERAHRTRLSTRFRAGLGRARIVCLDIPDRYGYMAPDLVDLLQARVARHLPPRVGAVHVD
ncbi:low molecular weight protein tyrosine phosphatase family protein [Luteimonas sp. BDR2-5]|uniref:low molecular weight protein tyrosine phosphatase family protein n=1 Tax=Proluteimonas luteida TaxID=2878685 RepID=UPI001E2C2CE7|nr:low molecular weight protein tyrosine phosphatase family protein [Luteimonas sp. BDR2-5]MCD9029165.1 low molecular weight protein tyrosine phosphatase family protein [Luteimonas sp. BDR2-5]